MGLPARYSGKKLIISPREALVANGPAEELDQTIQSHLAHGQRDIAIDLGAVPHMDSAGVRTLVRAHTAAARLGGRLTIVGPNEQVRSLLGVTGLDEILGITGSRKRGGGWSVQWPAVRLAAGGVLLVAALIWTGARWTTSPVPAPVTDLVAVQPSVTTQVFRSVPWADLAKLVAAAAIGILVTGVQRNLQRVKSQSRSLEHAKVLLCTAGALVMVIIGDSLARAFGIFGAASIVRFRTPIKDPKEITVLFILMGLGMLAGLGAFGAAGLSTAFLCVFLVLLDRIDVQKPRTMMVGIAAKGPEFPAAEVETILALNRIVFERREVSRGEKTVARYHVTLDPKASLDAISEQLIGDGTSGIKSVVWEPLGKGK